MYKDATRTEINTLKVPCLFWTPSHLSPSLRDCRNAPSVELSTFMLHWGQENVAFSWRSETSATLRWTSVRFVLTAVHVWCSWSVVWLAGSIGSLRVVPGTVGPLIGTLTVFWVKEGCRWKHYSTGVWPSSQSVRRWQTRCSTERSVRLNVLFFNQLQSLFPLSYRVKKNVISLLNAVVA